MSVTVSDELQCCVCLDIVQEAVESPCCRSLFCDHCAREAVSTSKKCPKCRSKVKMSGFKPNIPIRKIVDSLPAECPHEGCTDRVTRGNLDDHVRVCDSRMVLCSNDSRCDIEVQAKHLKLHEEEECVYRKIECPFKCGEMTTLSDLKEHERECGAVEEECEQCGELIPRGMMLQHLDQDCVAAKLPCPFAACGCAERHRRESMDGHISQSENEHCTMMEETMQLQVDEITKLQSMYQDKAGIIDDLVDEVDELEDQVQSIRIGLFEHEKLHVSAQLHGHRGCIWSSCELPENRVATAAQDGRIRLWQYDGSWRHVGKLKGHNGRVNGVCAGEGHEIFSCGGDGTIRRWDINRNDVGEVEDSDTEMVAPMAAARKKIRFKNTKKVDGHAGAVYSVSFDGELGAVASCGADGAVRLWKPQNLKSRAEARSAHAEEARSVLAHPDGVISGGEDGNIVFWNAKLRELARHNIGQDVTGVRALALCRDGTRVAAGMADGAIHLFDIAARVELCYMRQHTSPVTALEECGEHLVSADDQGSLCAWSTAELRLVTSAQIGLGSIFSLCAPRFTPALVCGNGDGAAGVLVAGGSGRSGGRGGRVSNVSEGARDLEDLAGIREELLVDVTARQSKLEKKLGDATSAEDRIDVLSETISLQREELTALRLAVEQAEKGVQNLRTRAKNAEDMLVSRGVSVLDCAALVCTDSLQSDHGPIWSVVSVFHSLATAAQDGSITLWSRSKATPSQSTPPSFRARESHDDASLVGVSESTSDAQWIDFAVVTGHAERVLALCAYRSHLFSGSGDATIAQWEYREGTYRKLHLLRGHKNSVYTLCIFRSDFLLSGGADGLIAVHRLDNNEHVETLRHKTTSCVREIVAGDTTSFFAVTEGRELFKWRYKPASGFKLKKSVSFGPEAEQLTCCALMRSLHVVAVGTAAGVIFIRDADTLERVAKLEGHTEEVSAMVVHRRHLVTASADMTLRIWKSHDWTLEKTLYGHAYPVRALAVCDNVLLSADEQGVLKTWESSASAARPSVKLEMLDRRSSRGLIRKSQDALAESPGTA